MDGLIRFRVTSYALLVLLLLLSTNSFKVLVLFFIYSKISRLLIAAGLAVD